MEIDLLVIGGGINGSGVAADAAGRGLSVILCEKDDLAFGTSSASSQLIHGGLRYLEQYDFRLVRAALKEREVLMQKAPHLIHPLEFILPMEKRLRSSLLIRIGLFLYDHLIQNQTLKKSKKLSLKTAAQGAPLKSIYTSGFSYSDCKTDDARLVVLNAIAARDNGAKILTRTRCKAAKRENDYWLITLHDRLRDKTFTLKAKAIVNAAGPWADHLIQDVANLTTKGSMRLIKGSHIIIPKLYEGTHAYILQNSDQRIGFAIPYQNKFTLVGTTEIPYDADPNQAAISNTELNYLCDMINRHFTKQISGDDIVWSYAGVRPLYEDHSKNLGKVTREYHLELNGEHGEAPILSIFGGKLTTFRILAEAVLKKLHPYFPKMGKPWTAQAKLPGGECDGLSYSDFLIALDKKYPWMPTYLLHRYAQNYGDLCHAILSDTHSIDDLGKHFGSGFYERELLYLVKNEWAQSADDILWRRTKLGLFLSQDEIDQIEKYLS